MDSHASDPRAAGYSCPCGAAWPCRCPAAWRAMGFGRPPDPGDDEDIVAIAGCPVCRGDVLLELDPASVMAWTERAGRRVVTEAGGPPLGECCGLAFVMQPDGEVESFCVKENGGGRGR